MAQLGARLDGIEEVVGSNPIGSTNLSPQKFLRMSYHLYILQSELPADITLAKRKISPQG